MNNTPTQNIVVAHDMRGNPIRVGDKVAYAVIQGYSTKQAVMRTGVVVEALVDAKGTRLKIKCELRGYPYRTTRGLEKLVVLS